MSARKSQKPELIAIYRLEFYKKQNKWKLGSSRKEKKTPLKSPENKKNLNVTYNVDHPDSKEQLDPLNVASVDSDSDKTTQTKCLKTQLDIKHRELSQEWQEPVNIWPSTDWDPCPIKDQGEKNQELSINNCANKGTLTPKTNALIRLQELQKAALYLEEQPKTEYLEDYCLQSCESHNVWVNENVDCEWKKQCYQDWPIDTDILNVGFVGQDIWTQAACDVIDGFDIPEDLINLEECREPGLFGDVPWTEGTAELSVDSEDEFLRGAHAAPHSSETELVLPPGLDAAGSSSLWRLSSRELLRAARRHSRALRRLLLESAHRQKLRTAASLNSFSGSSFEEFPTRDVGPHSVGDNDSGLNRNTFVKDVFITGSYKNDVARGRGRGRLLDTPLWR